MPPAFALSQDQTLKLNFLPLMRVEPALRTELRVIRFLSTNWRFSITGITMITSISAMQAYEYAQTRMHKRHLGLWDRRKIFATATNRRLRIPFDINNVKEHVPWMSEFSNQIKLSENVRALYYMPEERGCTLLFSGCQTMFRIFFTNKDRASGNSLFLRALWKFIMSIITVWSPVIFG